MKENSKIKTAGFVVENGKINYGILIDCDSDEYETAAAEELRFFIGEATGCYPEIVFESNGGKYFILGKAARRTRAADGLGITGARIVSEGDNLLLFGLTSYGTLHAVYEYLSIALDFDYFARDLWYIKHCSVLPFYRFDITAINDIDVHTASYGCVKSDPHFYRYGMIKNFAVPVNGKVGHNALEYLRFRDNAKSHPLWFNEKATQPCFTAHGDKAEYGAMLDCAFGELKKALKSVPEFNIVRFATEDSEDSCDCPECRAMREKYGADSAAEIIFLNALKKKIDDWLESDEGKPYKRDLKLVFYAYLAYLGAPVKKIDGAYFPLAREVKCSDGVVPILCFIEAKYSKSFLDPANAEWAEVVSEWEACSDELQFYFYDTDFHYMLAPYDTFSAMQENYRYVVRHKGKFLHNLGQASNPAPTGFSKLKVYLQSKLLKNVDCDTEKFTKKFFDNCYGAGGKEMLEFYRSYRRQAKKIHGALKFAERRNCECYGNPLDKKFWPKKLLDEWLALANLALKKLLPLTESDVNKFMMYADNIVAERLFVKYLLVELYCESYGEEQLADIKKSIKSDCLRLGFVHTCEGDKDSLWRIWGVETSN